MSSTTVTPAPAVLGELLHKAGFKVGNRPAFIVFFRSDCTWCTSEVPRLAIAFNRHLDLKVNVMGVAVGQDGEGTAQEFARDKGWHFPVVTDPDGTVKAAFGVERVPSVVLVNREGNIQRNYEGATEQLVGILEQTIFAAAHNSEPPAYNMVGNGCAP